MKFDFLKNKVFIISFIVLILFSFFNCNVFADSSYNADYDYMYTYEPFVDENIQKLVDDVVNDVRVLSGDYYYFVTYNYGDRCFNTTLLRKSSFSLSELSLVRHGWGEYSKVYNCNTELFFIQLPENFDISNDNLICFSGKNVFDSSYNGIKIDGLPDFDNLKFRFPFATNFTGNIVVHCHNNTTRDFFLGAPTFTLTKEVGQIPEIMTKIIHQVLPIGLIVLGIGLLIYLIRRVIYSMK